MTYVLPELPYDPAALEPHISGQIIELHHDKHHATYVSGANATVDKLAAARTADDFGAILEALLARVERFEIVAKERSLNNVLRGLARLEVTVS
jgi:superoxide dismutase